jgi:hypothetical protein
LDPKEDTEFTVNSLNLLRSESGSGLLLITAMNFGVPEKKKKKKKKKKKNAP